MAIEKLNLKKVIYFALGFQIQGFSNVSLIQI